jgi:hypothetical protein
VVVDLLRIGSYGAPVLVVVANAAAALAVALSGPALMTAVYNLAKDSPCTMRFQIAADGGWDAGAGAACLIGAAILWLGAPMQLAIALSLPGSIAVFALLRRYYAVPGDPLDGG